jgi:hypothetical protein
MRSLPTQCARLTGTLSRFAAGGGKGGGPERGCPLAIYRSLSRSSVPHGDPARLSAHARLPFPLSPIVGEGRHMGPERGRPGRQRLALDQDAAGARDGRAPVRLLKFDEYVTGRNAPAAPLARRNGRRVSGCHPDAENKNATALVQNAKASCRPRRRARHARRTTPPWTAPDIGRRDQRTGVATRAASTRCSPLYLSTA